MVTSILEMEIFKNNTHTHTPVTLPTVENTLQLLKIKSIIYYFCINRNVFRGIIGKRLKIKKRAYRSKYRQ